MLAIPSQHGGTCARAAERDPHLLDHDSLVPSRAADSEPPGTFPGVRLTGLKGKPDFGLDELALRQPERHYQRGAAQGGA